MITGRFSPLQIVSTLDKSSRLFGMRMSLRGKRTDWARLAWLANGTARTASETALRLNLGCDDERNVNVDVLGHLNQGGFTAINGTILPNSGQSYPAYDPLGNEDDVNVSPRTTKYRCWSLREGLYSRK